MVPNSVHVKAPVYVTRDLHLESTAVASLGAAEKAAIGRNLYLKNPQNQIGLTEAATRGSLRSTS